MHLQFVLLHPLEAHLALDSLDLGGHFGRLLFFEVLLSWRLLLVCCLVMVLLHVDHEEVGVLAGAPTERAFQARILYGFLLSLLIR